MGIEPAYILAAFAGGYSAHLVKLPPLLGFLVAGFALHAAGFGTTPALDVLADLGVTLLLFTIGLKLKVGVLLERAVWGAATLHMTGATLLAAGLLIGLSKVAAWPMLAGLDGETALLLGFALAFSSTVFAIKVLEDRSEANSFYGRVAVGVLIMQDIFAVLFMAISAGKLPSIWALGLLLLIPAAPLLQRLLARAGHGEVQTLFGIAMALVLGYGLFELLGMKGDLGALLVGMLLAPHPAAAALSRSLFNIKELFLVCFFLNLGLVAEPSWELASIALLLVVLMLPVKSLLYLPIFLLLRMRARSSLLATLTLSNFSEFGLIVGAVVVAQGQLDAAWLTVMALAVAMSFVFAIPLNQMSEALHRHFGDLLTRLQADQLHPSDQPIQLSSADVVILGMGRVGTGAARYLQEHHNLTVLGIEISSERVSKLRTQGFNVIEGDASDSDFWDKLLVATGIRLVVLAMPHHDGNLYALKQLDHSTFDGKVIALVDYDEDIAPLRELGANAVFHMHEEAGLGLAGHVVEQLGLQPHCRGSDFPAPATIRE